MHQGWRLLDAGQDYLGPLLLPEPFLAFHLPGNNPAERVVGVSLSRSSAVRQNIKYGHARPWPLKAQQMRPPLLNIQHLTDGFAEP